MTRYDGSIDGKRKVAVFYTHLEEANQLVDIAYLVRSDLQVRNWASSGK